MKILEVTEASAAGTLNLVSALAAGLAREGHDVTLAYADRPDTPSDLAEMAPGVQLAPIAWRRRSPLSHASAGRAVRRLVREGRPDVVHLHSSFAGAVGSVAAHGVPRVYTPHGYAFARRPDSGGALAAYRAVERVVARRSRVVAAVSEAEAALARGIGAPRVEVVLNGIPSLDAPVTPVPPRAQPLVAGLGRVGPARRPSASARILAAVGARALWIGDGEAGPLRAAGVPVTGWLPHAEALDRLAGATVLLHWSDWDGAPLAVLEAMARDVLVIASDIPANRELLGPRQVFSGEEAAAAAIRAALHDPTLREELLAEQRARAAGRGAALMVERYAALYARCAAPVRAVQPWPRTADPRTIERTWS